MSVRAPLAAGTVLSLAVVSAWSYIASLAIGPAGRCTWAGTCSDYAQLAAAPTGNAAELFVVVAAIYAVCLLASGWRQHCQRRGGGA